MQIFCLRCKAKTLHATAEKCPCQFALIQLSTHCSDQELLAQMIAIILFSCDSLVCVQNGHKTNDSMDRVRVDGLGTCPQLLTTPVDFFQCKIIMPHPATSSSVLLSFLFFLAHLFLVLLHFSVFPNTYVFFLSQTLFSLQRLVLLLVSDTHASKSWSTQQNSVGCRNKIHDFHLCVI